MQRSRCHYHHLKVITGCKVPAKADKNTTLYAKNVLSCVGEDRVQWTTKNFQLFFCTLDILNFEKVQFIMNNDKKFSSQFYLQSLFKPEEEKLFSTISWPLTLQSISWSFVLSAQFLWRSIKWFFVFLSSNRDLPKRCN